MAFVASSRKSKRLGSVEPVKIIVGIAELVNTISTTNSIAVFYDPATKLPIQLPKDAVVVNAYVDVVQNVTVSEANTQQLISIGDEKSPAALFPARATAEYDGEPQTFITKVKSYKIPATSAIVAKVTTAANGTAAALTAGSLRLVLFVNN